MSLVEKKRAKECANDKMKSKELACRTKRQYKEDDDSEKSFRTEDFYQSFGNHLRTEMAAI